MLWRAMPATSHNDIYSRITNQIIQAMEAGAGDWRMPWHTDGLAALRPVNAQNGKAYRGVNVLALWCAAQEAGYESDLWATYKQWQEIGAQVRKGEKASSIVFWKINEDGAESGSEASEDEPNGHKRIVARGYAVFNAHQVEGYELPKPQPRRDIERIQSAEQFFGALQADIRHGGAKAFYRASSDHIQMPHFENFRDAIAYYAVLAHEVTHWTGAPPRLNRDLKGRFGDESYAGEELVAELGAAFLCADLGLCNEPRPDHAAYVANWLKVLKNDNRAIFTAAAKAQQAVDFAHNLQMQAAPENALVPFASKGQLGLSF
jgi:antirestriction protein ArdC